MKRIGLILLFIFVPLLLFRIFLNVDFNESEIIFTVLCFIILTLMYLIAYFYALYQFNKKQNKKINKNQFITTFITNQGRSSAFIGGAMLAISAWSVYAAIYMSIGAIFLFAIIPYFLSHFHKKSFREQNNGKKLTALPWYLKIFPWYLLIFALSSIAIHGTTGIYLTDLGDLGVFFKFFTALTIPAALYYVGAGIHPNDLKKNELKKLFQINARKSTNTKWMQIRLIFLLTVVITPLITCLIIIPLYLYNLIPDTWFSVILINSFLPITSTNMFLVPYGINPKVTALSVTWTTIICVPIVVVLITLFRVLSL